MIPSSLLPVWLITMAIYGSESVTPSVYISKSVFEKCVNLASVSISNSDSNVTVIISNCTFLSNLRAIDSSTNAEPVNHDVQIADTLFLSNGGNLKEPGGALYFSGTFALIANCHFINNTAVHCTLFFLPLCLC